MSDNKSGNAFIDMFQKFGQDLKLPTADIESIVDHHRRNIQALSDSARVTAEGTQKLMAKQRETLEDTLAEITIMVQDAVESKDPAKIISDQSEFARRSFETTVKNATEISDTIRETGTDAFNILKDRVGESVEELRTSMHKKD